MKPFYESGKNILSTRISTQAARMSWCRKKEHCIKSLLHVSWVYMLLRAFTSICQYHIFASQLRLMAHDGKGCELLLCYLHALQQFPSVTKCNFCRMIHNFHATALWFIFYNIFVVTLFLSARAQVPRAKNANKYRTNDSFYAYIWQWHMKMQWDG